MAPIFDIIKKRAFSFVCYLDVLFFFEIINLMFLLLMAYGKFTAITAGIILTLLLSLHIISLYFKKEINRKIQLYMMDLHLAYSIPFIISFAVYNRESGIFDYLFVFVRFVISCFEILFIFILSDYKEESCGIL